MVESLNKLSLNNLFRKLNIIYRNAFAEVEYIINNLPQEEIEKIPSKFRKFIEKEKNTKYNVEIDMDIELKEQNILKETRYILTIIYKLYLATETEKEKLIELEKLKRGN